MFNTIYLNVSKNSILRISFIVTLSLLTVSLFTTFVLADEAIEPEAETEEVSDPLEPFNRGVFWLNDTLDVYAIEPVATVYDFVTPQRLQNSVRSFFYQS
jgi:phospholipid-binding lipoprotein MlaA